MKQLFLIAITAVVIIITTVFAIQPDGLIPTNQQHMLFENQSLEIQISLLQSAHEEVKKSNLPWNVIAIDPVNKLLIIEIRNHTAQDYHQQISKLFVFDVPFTVREHVDLQNPNLIDVMQR